MLASRLAAAIEVDVGDLLRGTLRPAPVERVLVEAFRAFVVEAVAGG
jgi:hypothetical protein